jgi:hypothetical protein
MAALLVEMKCVDAANGEAIAMSTVISMMPDVFPVAKL